MTTKLEELSLEEMKIILEIYEQQTLSVLDEQQVMVERTIKCLLCGDEVIDEYLAKEVLSMTESGKVKHVRLISDNGGPLYFTTYRYITHRTHCPVCPARLRRLTKGQLVDICIRLAQTVLYSAKKAGNLDYMPAEEVKRHDK